MVTVLTLSRGRSSPDRIGWHVSSASSLPGVIFACKCRAVAPGKRLLSCCGSGANGAYEMSRLTRSATLCLQEWARRTVSTRSPAVSVILATLLQKDGIG